MRRGRVKLRDQVPSAHLDFGSCVSFCIHTTKIGLRVLTKYENLWDALFPLKTAVTTVIAGTYAQQFLLSV